MGVPTADQEYPVLASWQYGLGKAIAWTSDARSQEGTDARQFWDRDWARSPIYTRFWERLLDSAMRGVESGRLLLTTEYRDGRVRVIVEAREPSPDGKGGKPITDLRLTGGVTPPGAAAGGKPIELRFEQKNAGQYEAEFRADESGSYFVNALSRRTVTTMRDGKPVTEEQTDGVRAGVTLPYSPEFADLESNTPLLERLAESSGGRVFAEKSITDAAVQRDVFRSGGTVTKSLRPCLVLAGGAVRPGPAARRGGPASGDRAGRAAGGLAAAVGQVARPGPSRRGRRHARSPAQPQGRGRTSDRARPGLAAL